MSQTYRNKWTEYLTFIKDKMFELKDVSNVDSKIIIDMTNDFIVLTQLAKKEIELDESEENKCLAEANIGLDCASMFANSILMFATNKLENTELKKVAEVYFLLVSKMDRLDESMLSESYRSNV